MIPEPVPCPYCNALVPVGPGVGGGPFLSCPRCGERFVYRAPGMEAVQATAEAQAGPGLPGLDREPAREPLLDRVGERLRGSSRRRIALTVLGVMIVMAGAGLALALLTQGFRRANDQPKGSGTANPVVQVTPPAELSGLGYLPPDTDIIAGVHVAEALQDPIGRLILERFRPAQALAEGPDQAAPQLDSLERWTGLRLREVDHIVLGLNITNRLLPKVVLVVQTRQPYDPEKVRAALKARASPEPGKPLYRFQLEGQRLDAVVWFAGERTLIVGREAEDLQDVPATPRAGIAHLSVPLQTMLRERLGRVAPVWAVGHSDDWDKTAARLLLASRPKEARRTLESVRSFGVWLELGQGITLGGAFHCADEKAARSLESHLAPPAGAEPRPLSILGSRPDAEPLARELGQSLKVVRQDDWVNVQAKADTDAVRQALTGSK